MVCGWVKSFNHLLGQFWKGVRHNMEIFSLVPCLPQKGFSNSYPVCLQTPLSLVDVLRIQWCNGSICSRDLCDGLCDGCPDSKNLRTEKKVEKEGLETVSRTLIPTWNFRSSCFQCASYKKSWISDCIPSERKVLFTIS